MTDSQKELFEKLAAIEHERWASWQKWVHDCMDKLPDGLFLPLEFWARWEKQINTPYEELSEREKQSDRDQVMRYWHLIQPEQKGDASDLERRIAKVLHVNGVGITPKLLEELVRVVEEAK